MAKMADYAMVFEYLVANNVINFMQFFERRTVSVIDGRGNIVRTNYTWGLTESGEKLYHWLQEKKESGFPT